MTKYILFAYVLREPLPKVVVNNCIHKVSRFYLSFKEKVNKVQATEYAEMVFSQGDLEAVCEIRFSHWYSCSGSGLTAAGHSSSGMSWPKAVHSPGMEVSRSDQNNLRVT